jgi:hypothetical protein
MRELLTPTRAHRYRKRQWRLLVALVTLPGVAVGTVGLTAAYATGLLRHGPPSPSCTSTIVHAPDRGSFGLSVLNATGESGVAARVGRELRLRSFRIVEVSNAPEGLYIEGPGIIYYGNRTLEAALSVQTQMPGATLRFDGRADDTVSLVIGSGFTALADPSQRETVAQPCPAAALKEYGARLRWA